jgi:hypothetical protein
MRGGTSRREQGIEKSAGSTTSAHDRRRWRSISGQTPCGDKSEWSGDPLRSLRKCPHRVHRVGTNPNGAETLSPRLAKVSPPCGDKSEWSGGPSLRNLQKCPHRVHRVGTNPNGAEDPLRNSQTSIHEEFGASGSNVYPLIVNSHRRTTCGVRSVGLAMVTAHWNAATGRQSAGGKRRRMLGASAPQHPPFTQASSPLPCPLHAPSRSSVERECSGQGQRERRRAKSESAGARSESAGARSGSEERSAGASREG